MSRVINWRPVWLWLCFVVPVSTGCTSPLFRGQSPEPSELERLVADEPKVKYVGDLATPWGTMWQKLEGVGLVTQLAGTGSDPPPSEWQKQLLKELQTHEVNNARAILASTDTAMVLVGGYVPPGAQQGDTFDVLVTIPPRTGATSLNGGWLMQTRMRELLVLDRRVHTSDVGGLAGGEVLTHALFNKSEDETLLMKGRVIGGGVVSQTRRFGLSVHEEDSSVRTSAMIGAAINDRFHQFNRGERSGIATPKTDNRIDLTMYARYKQNFTRYIRVIMNIAVEETPAARADRLLLLDRMLQEPTTAELAALRLEAIGSDAAPILRRALTVPDAEVRFYASEALAYLDDPAAAEPLYEAARDEYAFRWRALTALAAMEQIAAQDALVRLLDETSAETRYGAFRALRVNNGHDPLVRGEVLGRSFGYHVVHSTAEPMIHFTRSRRPEVVLFGQHQQIDPPAFLYAGKDILIKGVERDKLKVSRFRPNQETEQVFCSTSLDDLIRTIVEVGGSYQEVMMAIESAKDSGYLDSRVVIAASASPQRIYHRQDAAPQEPAPEARYHVTHPVPELFTDRLDDGEAPQTEDEHEDLTEPIEPPVDTTLDRTDEGWFDKITNWFSS